MSRMPADRDAEGDSEMLSDNSSPQNNTGNRAPEANTSKLSTARGAGSSRNAPELSPPPSQDTAMTVDQPDSTQGYAFDGQGFTAHGESDHPGGDTAFSAEELAKMTEPGSRGQKDYMQAEPGSAWKSKTAHDEYQRVMENVVDRDFSLAQFGDPFDERDMEMRTK